MDRNRCSRGERGMILGYIDEKNRCLYGWFDQGFKRQG